MYVRFRYATDEAFNGVGWYVDDISLGSFSDPVAAVNGWTTERLAVHDRPAEQRLDRRRLGALRQGPAPLY